MSLEQELHQTQKQLGQLQSKYAKKCRILNKVNYEYSALKSEERKRKRNENKAGLKVRSV